jgi:hypothetical protein
MDRCASGNEGRVKARRQAAPGPASPAEAARDDSDLASRSPMAVLTIVNLISKLQLMHGTVNRT